MRATKAVVAMLVACVLAGCGSGPAPVPSRVWIGRDVPNPGALPGLAFTVTTDKASYRVGESIAVTIHVTNTSINQIVLNYGVFVPELLWGYIIAHNGRIVTYEYWEGRNLAFPQIAGSQVYAPGETRNYTLAFPLDPGANDPDPVGPLAPGTYQIYAKGPPSPASPPVGTPIPLSDPVTISVTP